MGFEGIVSKRLDAPYRPDRLRTGSRSRTRTARRCGERGRVCGDSPLTGLVASRAAAHDIGMTSLPLWWLTYRRDGKLSGVVIMEAHALIDARMKASLKGLENGVAFAEGHRLDDAASKALVLPKQLGRMLSVEEAKRLLEEIEGKRR
jgi:hypothetical protein